MDVCVDTPDVWWVVFVYGLTFEKGWTLGISVPKFGVGGGFVPFRLRSRCMSMFNSIISDLLLGIQGFGTQ